VAGGFILFLIIIFLIGRQKNLFDPVFKLTTNFYNVSGLQVGNNIRFSGINIGTVGSIIILNDSTIQVDMVIKKNVRQFIKTDCQVAIGSEGIIGDRVLIITQGSSEAQSVKDEQFLSSIEPTETDAIIASLYCCRKSGVIQGSLLK
jgi:phospholipid/cholesterol/gamma-HCH transport system substrate-binding protein